MLDLSFEGQMQLACAIPALSDLIGQSYSTLFIFELRRQSCPHSSPLHTHAFAAWGLIMIALVAEHHELLACAIWCRLTNLSLLYKEIKNPRMGIIVGLGFFFFGLSDFPITGFVEA